MAEAQQRFQTTRPKLQNASRQKPMASEYRHALSQFEELLPQLHLPDPHLGDYQQALSSLL